MGEIADMILDGILDEQTGEYIGPGVGYPRTMQRDTPGDATNGVIHYLRGKGIKDRAEQIKFIENYMRSIDIKPDNMKKTAMCEKIQENFSSFCSYYQKNK